MSKLLTYQDVCLVPRFSDCETRASCDTSHTFLGRKFKLPIMPANMKAVIDKDWAYFLSENDYFYSMHRFDIDQEEFVREANRDNWKLVSISVGVKNYENLIYDFHSSGLRVDFITIDIAHGHSASMKRTIKYIKETLPETKIIAGNVATREAVRDLYSWGADAVKVGIGQGSPCTTKNKTGFTMPMFSCVQQCAGQLYGNTIFDDCGSNINDDYEKIPIIADGGIMHNGDIAKALVAGADFVMAGGIFAACMDSPASPVEINGEIHKAYFGSASFENKKVNRNIEGTLRKLSNNGMNLQQKLQEITQDLQSAISYGGGRELKDLKKVQYKNIN